MNYRRGYDAEMKAVKALAACGYVTARTAGSHSPFDVVAVSGNGVRLIQVKRVRAGGSSAGRISSVLEAARREIRQVPSLPGVTREVWVWYDGRGWVAQEVV